MKELGFWKSRKEWKRLTQGMNPDQVARLKASLSQGDEAQLAAIAEIQAEQREELKEQGLDYDEVTPVIGTDIAWSEILSMAFRVSDFDKNETEVTGSGEVKAKSSLEPYGYLLVDSPTLNQSVALPIIHRDDFMLATFVFDDPEVMHMNEVLGRELLVTYQPKKTMKDGRAASPAHCLHYALVPTGTLDKYYSDDRRMARPDPKLLFGKFVYSGEISVFMNPDPRV
jgi:hypothetical protein